MKYLLLSCLVMSGLVSPGVAQQSAAKRVFRSSDEILNVVPATIVVRQKGDLNAAAVAQANETLKRDAVGQSAELRTRIERVQKSTIKAYPPGFVVFGPPVRLRRGADTVMVQVTLYFPATEAPDVAKLKPDTDVVATGTIARADYNVGKRGLLKVFIDLTGSKVK